MDDDWLEYSPGFRPTKKVSGFWSPMMSDCSQNCWIDWNSALLCFVRPLVATILCIWEIWSPRIQYIITYFPVGKKKMTEYKARHSTDFEADR